VFSSAASAGGAYRPFPIEDLVCDPRAGVEYRGFGESLHLFEIDASADELAEQLKEVEKAGE
jgi:hypothetical protein